MGIVYLKICTIQEVISWRKARKLVRRHTLKGSGDFRESVYRERERDERDEREREREERKRED